ncbi:MAG: polysaccharide deacetylase family protein [Saprospiraceae bacterium]|nr:polysaccharide deacetylase family protein [Saprospiraceae bacterium]
MNTSKIAKYLIIHADDAGLCQSENKATIESLRRGIVNSYSIMTTCSGFDEIAKFAKNNPEFDYGIHLTLTCEWENQRFGPVLPITEVPSLVDEYGHFFKTREKLKNRASNIDIKKELEAQINKAYDYGLNPSHIDSHMYSIGITEASFSIYRNLGIQFGLPVFMNHEVLSIATKESLIKKEDFLIDHFFIGDFEDFKNGTLLDYYFKVLDGLKPGINILLLHPSFDSEEMREITFNHPNFGSEWRAIDFAFITSEKAKSKIKENDIQLIDWRSVWKRNNPNTNNIF